MRAAAPVAKGGTDLTVHMMAVRSLEPDANI